jgi:hypothetical protein
VAWFRDSSFAVGMFGMNYRETNFTLATPDLVPSFLSTVYAQGKIPSLSYSYVAGAYYKLNDGGQGGLVLGGYDKALFTPNDVVFPFNEDQSVDLSVGLQAIFASNILSSSVVSSNTPAAKLVK